MFQNSLLSLINTKMLKGKYNYKFLKKYSFLTKTRERTNKIILISNVFKNFEATNYKT